MSSTHSLHEPERPLRRGPSRLGLPPKGADSLGPLGTLLVLLLLVVALLWCLWWAPVFTLGCLVCLLGLAGLSARHNSRLRAQRSDESICTFARGFGRRAVDTWVVRATYEELAQWAGFPPRATDRLSEEYGIEDDDVLDLVELVAERAGVDEGSLDSGSGMAPLETTGDVVRYLSRRPLIPTPTPPVGAPG